MVGLLTEEVGHAGASTHARSLSEVGHIRVVQSVNVRRVELLFFFLFRLRGRTEEILLLVLLVTRWSGAEGSIVGGRLTTS
jgi:hypothetical protein